MSCGIPCGKSDCPIGHPSCTEIHMINQRYYMGLGEMTASLSVSRRGRKGLVYIVYIPKDSSLLIHKLSKFLTWSRDSL